MASRAFRAALLAACASIAPVSSSAQSPPDAVVTPTSFEETLATGDQVTRTLAIANQGGSDLTWRLTAGSDSLESVLSSLDANFSSVTAVIPGRYAFTEGDTGDHIEDGGGNMYDGGNFLLTDRGGPLAYTDGAITASSFLGPSGRYFTRKYPGLFVLAADLDAVQTFTIDGDLGANGSGSADITVTQYLIGGDIYLGFVKRVYGTGAVPSVNHMVLVQLSDTLGIEFSSNTNSDFQRVTGLSGTRRLYYLLYAGTNGGYIDDEACTEVMAAFLDTLGPSWMRVDPRQGIVAAGEAAVVAVTLDAAGLFAGGYDAAIVLSSDDPDASSLSVPVHLLVTGTPVLDLSTRSLDFGAIYVGDTATRDLEVHNAGTATLTVSGISSDHPEFTPSETGFTVAPGQTHTLPVTFHPEAPASVGATLTFLSDDPDEPEVAVALHGVGLAAPDIGVSPASFDDSLITGERAEHTLTVANTGGATLAWTLSSGGFSSLADVGARLEESAASILEAIPGHYLFSEGEGGNSISDGGGDMYDGGNYLLTDLGGPVSYTDGPVVSSPAFGTEGRYFTRKYPGLFVLAADLSGVSEFRIEGNLGADGGGFVDGRVLDTTLGGARYLAFVKRVYGAGDPSVNHMIIVEQRATLDHQFSADTNDDLHRVTGLFGSTRLYYLLYAGAGGRYINDAETQGILSTFLGILGPQWLSVGFPQGGSLGPGTQATIPVAVDATGMIGGDYAADLLVASNDPDEPEITVPVRVHVTGAADVDVAPLSLDFGSIFVGGTSARTVTVRNLGTDVLHVTAVTFDHGDFAAETGSFSLPVGATRTLGVIFTAGTVGSTEATMTLVCDDPDEPSVVVALQGVGLVAPEVEVSPASFSESLFTGQTVTRTLVIENTGGSPLDYALFVRAPEAAAAPASLAPTLAGTYSGTHLAFGISNYGELMPFQSPPGVEHLQWGTFLSGHTVAYVAGGQDHVCYAVYDDRWCLLPVSYREVSNTPEEAEVEVVSGTADGALRLTQTFTFRKAARYVQLKTRVTNLTAESVSDVVLKWVTDWDVQGLFSNGWDYDRDRNAVLAWEGSYVAVAGVQDPAFMDLNGWNDIDSRNTVVDFPTGPADFDGVGLLHFQLGDLAPGASRDVSVVYAAAPNLETLRQAIDAGRGADWIRLEPASGSVPAGESRTVQVILDAAGLIGGDYDAEIVVETNDPDQPEVAVPAHLHVTGAPDVEVTPALIDFGEVFVGAVTSRTLSVTNGGTDRLTVSAVSLEHLDFAVDRASFTLAVGETRTLTVFFGPHDHGPTSATLTFTSDDPDEPTVAVVLQGQGVEAPVLGFSPASLSESLLTGQTVTRTLTIGNRGGTDLTFSIAIGAARASMRPTWVPPSVPPPSSSAEPRYAQGGTPRRAPQVHVHAPPPPGSVLGTFPVLLIQSGGEPEDLRDRLLEFPDISDVDVFDARAGTPTLEDLAPYHAVLVADELPFTDAVAMGDVLADYVDGGGGVVLLLASFVDVWSVRGRFMDEGYSPFGIGDGPLGSASLGTYDATHPIMRDVTMAEGDVLGSAPLTSGARLVASWNNGLKFVATQGNHVAAVNVFTSTPGYWWGDVPLILHNALFWSAAVDWLSAAPLSGVVPPGETREVTVTFDAGGLDGGDYDARIVLTSNDPLQPEKRIPAALHVTGAPDIEVTPPSVEFGTLFVGSSAVRTVTVANRGTDVLTVSGITFDHPDFTADADSFTLGPRQSRSVQVTWSPEAPGAVAAILTVASDDPDQPDVSAALVGLAVIPPDIGVSPASFTESLFTGGTVTRTLTIENTGGSDLTFQVSAGAEDALTVRRVLLLENTWPWNKNANELVLQAAGIPYDVVGSAGLPFVNLSLYGHVIVASDQPTSFYQALVANRGRIEAWVSAGGVLEFHAAGWGSNGGNASLVTLPGGMRILQHFAEENFVVLPGHPVVAGVADPIVGNLASHATFADVPSGATTIVSDDTGAPDLVVYPFGAGTVVAGGQTFEFQFPVWGSSQILQNMIPWANGRLEWLSVDPVAGSVPAGGSIPVTVTFDAEGLFGGDYQALVRVTSNDPDESTLTLPAQLHVTGAPDVEVAPGALSFDPVFVGATATQPLTVKNLGTDVLTVSSATVDSPFFTVDASTFTLAVGESRTLIVTFAPTAPGSVGGVLALVSDDPDEPTVSIALQGVGLIAPDVAVAPASFEESLFTGQAVSRTLTIENTGGSDLTFAASTAHVGARLTLLLQSGLPWSSNANPIVLGELGIPYEPQGTGSLPLLNLSRYDHIVVAGDQPTSAYQVIADNRARIDAWVSAGGVLEFHAAGFGWQGGDASLVTLPGGMRIVHGSADTNPVLMPDHPLVAGLPSPLAEYQVNIAHFADVPGNGSVVTSDPAGHPTLVYYRYGAGHVVASGHPLEFAFPNRLASSILFNMTQWADGLQAWLSVDPTSGSVPAGGSMTLSVLFDAAGMSGGDYAASVVVTSNDPDEPTVTIPAALHVTGAPDVAVAPSALVFDPVFVGGTATKAVTVTNLGTDLLTVSAVSSDHPDFTVDVSSFTLNVGESRAVTVTFAPSLPTLVGAMLVISSDDPDEPEVSIALEGVGQVAPDVAVSPASFSESLLTGQTVSRTLTIENTGGSDLTFAASVGASAARLGAGRTLLLQDNLPWNSSANQDILDALGISYDLRDSASLATLNLSLYDHILVSGDQTTFFYQVFASNRARIEAWVSGGGVLEFHAAGFGWQAGNASLVTLPGGMRIVHNNVDLNPVLMPDHPMVFGLQNPLEEDQVSIAYFTDTPGEASVVTTDPIGNPTLVFYRYGSGHVVASGHPLEYTFPERLASVILIQMIQWADGLETWLAVNPPSGSVPAGGSRTLSVLFNAVGLSGGDYAGSILVTSNDPDEPLVTLPASLHVTGAPDVDVEPDSLDFSTVLVGDSAIRTVTVHNRGTDVLTVSAITFDHGDFSADADLFSLAAGESRNVSVTYAPSGSGSVAATLLLSCNDPDQPAVSVSLAANAIFPGDIAVDPASIEETVRPGMVSTRTLTLTNTGDADLTFQIHSAATALGAPSLLLITAGADVADLRTELSALAGVGAVDVFDGAMGTPSAAELAPYGTVVLVSGLQQFFDSAEMGNALADYVDGGGGVILTFSSFLSGWGPTGRFASGYSPFTLANTLVDARPLGTFQAGHPIFVGISGIVGFPSDVGLAPGADLVGQWEGGLPFVATQGSKVVGANIYLASPGTWQGPVAALIRNAALWITGRQGSWLGVVPRTGVLHGQASVPVTLTFDASQLEEGAYSSSLFIETNDGDEPSVIVPLTLTVASCTPVPESCNGIDDDCDGQVDEELPALVCGIGACQRTVDACVSGVPQVCLPGTPADESCNGIDDDCNGVADDGGHALCDDGDPCTSDACHQSEGCSYAVSGACHASPRGVGFWRRLCQGPHPEGEIAQADVDCVQETCTFAGVQTIPELCARLTPSDDWCAQADAQLMALTLNHCQGRIVDTAPILSTCAASTTVGQSRGEADVLLCPPLRDQAACKQAHCQAEEINSGQALQANSLRVRRTLDGKTRLDWAPPYGDAESGPPEFYRVRRRSGSEASFQVLIETPDLFYVDWQAAMLPAAQYEVTPVWK